MVEFGIRRARSEELAIVQDLMLGLYQSDRKLSLIHI